MIISQAPTLGGTEETIDSIAQAIAMITQAVGGAIGAGQQKQTAQYQAEAAMWGAKGQTQTAMYGASAQKTMGRTLMIVAGIAALGLVTVVALR